MGTNKMSRMNIYYRFKVKMPAKQHLTLAHLLQHRTTCKILNGHWVWKVFNTTPSKTPSILLLQTKSFETSYINPIRDSTKKQKPIQGWDSDNFSLGLDIETLTVAILWVKRGSSNIIDINRCSNWPILDTLFDFLWFYDSDTRTIKSNLTKGQHITGVKWWLFNFLVAYNWQI